MKNLLYLLVTPVMMIDACSSPRLEKADTEVMPPPAIPVQYNSDRQPATGEKVIVISYSAIEDGDFTIHTRLHTEIQVKPVQYKPWQSNHGKKSIAEIIH